MNLWSEALNTAEKILATPVEDGFPLPGTLFSNLGPLPVECADRAVKVAELIGERITATETLADATKVELGWTRDRMHDLLPSGGSPVYLDITA